MLKEPQTPPPTERFKHISAASPVASSSPSHAVTSVGRPETKSQPAPTRPSSCGAISTPAHARLPVDTGSQPVLHSPVVGSVLPPRRHSGGPQSPRHLTSPPLSPLRNQGTNLSPTISSNTPSYTGFNFPSQSSHAAYKRGRPQSGIRSSSLDHSKDSIHEPTSTIAYTAQHSKTVAVTKSNSTSSVVTTGSVSNSIGSTDAHKTLAQPTTKVTVPINLERTSITTPGLSQSVKTSAPTKPTSSKQHPTTRTVAVTKSTSSVSSRPVMSAQEALVIKQAQAMSEARKANIPISQLDELKMIAKASEQVTQKLKQESETNNKSVSNINSKENIVPPKTSATLTHSTTSSALPSSKLTTNTNISVPNRAPITTTSIATRSTLKPSVTKSTATTSKQTPIILPVIGKQSMLSCKNHILQASVSTVPKDAKLVSPSLVRVQDSKTKVMIGKPKPVEEDVITAECAAKAHVSPVVPITPQSQKIPKLPVSPAIPTTPISAGVPTSPITTNVPMSPISLISPVSNLRDDSSKLISSSLDSLLEANLPDTPTNESTLELMMTSHKSVAHNPQQVIVCA